MAGEIIGVDTLVKGGLTLFDERKRLANPLKKIRRRLKDGKTVILVFGPGGVGKTTLGTILSEDFDALSTPPLEYKESREPETFYLRADPTQSLIIAPGQEQRIDHYWSSLLDKLHNAKKPIIINVVSYGYHSLSETKRLPEEATPETYFEESRQRELAIVQGLANYLDKTIMPLKMLTLVTKQDLWWNQREDVRQYYEEGEYSKAIRQIQTAKGNHHFSHEYGYCALFLHNLKSSDGRELALTTAGYDDTLRLSNQRTAFEVIERFAQ